jgi:predicted NACHT family NTPase
LSEGIRDESLAERGGSSHFDILLQGGPGQGKSTLTQLMAQIYRAAFLNRELETEDRWPRPAIRRLPIRVELKRFAEAATENTEMPLEEFIAAQIREDAGGGSFSVSTFHRIVEHGYVVLLLDGLDEVGSEEMRDRVIDSCLSTIERLRGGLQCDIKVVLTTRPPAISGRRRKLRGFTDCQLLPMDRAEVDDFLKRWTDVQMPDEEERVRVKRSFESRREEAHVNALVV